MTALAPRAIRPPGPAGHPLLGHARELSRDTLGFLRRCAREHGDVVALRYYWKPIVFLNHPDHVEQLLAVHQRDVVKDVGQRSDRALIGDGLFLREGDAWRRRRRLLQPAFHRERIAAYGEAMVACAERLAGAWSVGGERDVYHDMSQVTMAVVAKTLFGADVWDDAAEVADALGQALDCLEARVRTLEVLLPDALPTPTNRRLRAARRRIDAVLRRVIAERRAAGGGDDLLATLIEARDEDGQPLTDQEVRDEAMTMFVGGYETAADLLAWTWLLLARSPAAEAALHAELDGVLGGRPPTAADVPHLPYTGKVVSEALRLYPPAPALGREAVVDFEVGGYRIAAGTDVLVSQWVLHRDPRFFDEPDRFRPERWTDDFTARLPRYAYFPFGGGPRLCIGHAFARMEAVLVLATLARRCRAEALPGQPPGCTMVPTLRPVPELRMVVRRR